MPSIIRRQSLARRAHIPYNSSSSSSFHTPSSSFLEVPSSINDVMHFTTKSMKRFSLHSHRSSSNSSSASSQYSARGSSSALSTPRSSLDQIYGSATLDINVESPPMVCFGTPDESSGALLNGFLYMDIGNSAIELDKLELFFQTTVTTKKPVHAHCLACSSHVTNLQTWTFVNDPVVAKHGKHSYPFSYHFPGHLPATTNSILASIKYQLVAIGTTSYGEEIKITKDIRIWRALTSDQERQSIRIFPPTTLSANLILPPVVHIGGDFSAEMKLEGMVDKEKNSRWKIRKMSWKIDETSKVVSPACKIHANKVGGEGKGILYEDTRTIAGAEVKNAFKTDLDSGNVEVNFQAGIPVYSQSCNDVSTSAGGINVSHVLIIELIVAEEYVPKNPKMVTPTGAARVLRMQFNLPVSDRGGMGISWENECPPLYTDVPASPPTYLDDEDLPPSFEESIEYSIDGPHYELSS